MSLKKLIVLIVFSFIVQVALSGSENTRFSSSPDTVCVGLMVSGKDNLSAKHAVLLAIENANKRSNEEKQFYKLIIRSAEGPWGTGSNELVKMIHHDEVSVIIGSLDSRNAHLAEQIAAKTHVVFLSTWAIDPSLSQAFVPWYFRCIPNAQQQAKNLAKTIYKSSAKGKVGIISDNSYEEGFILKYFKKETSLLNEQEPCIFELANSTEQNINELLTLLSNSEVKKLMFFTRPETAKLVLEEIRLHDLNFDLFGVNALTGSSLTCHLFWAEANGATDYFSSPAGKSFLNIFEKTYGYKPDAKAAYAYDGTNLIIEAIGKAGSDREKIKDVLKEISFTNGVTGTIMFDDKGNRVNGSD